MKFPLLHELGINNYIKFHIVKYFDVGRFKESKENELEIRLFQECSRSKQHINTFLLTIFNM